MAITTFTVQGSGDNVYEVTGDHCTCPDHKYRGNFCKHLKMAANAAKLAKVKSNRALKETKFKGSAKTKVLLQASLKKKLQKKMRHKRGQISKVFGLNKFQSSLLLMKIADEVGVGDDFMVPSKAKEARDKVSTVLRKPGFQDAVREFNAKTREFCAIDRPVAAPKAPILVQPRGKVGKVGCGKGSHQLYMTEM